MHCLSRPHNLLLVPHSRTTSILGGDSRPYGSHFVERLPGSIASTVTGSHHTRTSGSGKRNMRAAYGSSVQPNAPDNPNPEVKVLERQTRDPDEPLTLKEHVFEIIRDIRDPEYPHSLEELAVVKLEYVHVENPATDSPGYGTVSVQFHPTVPHCSLASMIGLSIRSKLKESRVLEPRGEQYFKLKVSCIEGTHNNFRDINKQLADKERVSAAFENPKIMTLLRECTDNLP